MNLPHALSTALWVVPLFLQTAIALVMIRRRLVNVFPLFFSYTVVVVVRDAALLAIKYPSDAYSLAYWIGEALAVFLSLGVIVENIKHLFPPYPFLKAIVRGIWLLSCVGAIMAFILIALDKGGPENDRVFETIVLAERSTRFLQTSLLVVVMSLTSRLGLMWRWVSVGIIVGFGIYSALALAAFELRSHLHAISDYLLVILQSAAYNLAVVIWAAYLLPPRRPPADKMPQTNWNAWNAAVTSYVDEWYRR